MEEKHFGVRRCERKVSIHDHWVTKSGARNLTKVFDLEILRSIFMDKRILLDERESDDAMPFSL